MSELYLIRHGITEGNKNKLYYGSTDLSLCEKGIEEVNKRIARNMYPHPEDYTIVTSALKRAKETFSLIYGNISHLEDKRLNEMDFGDFEMKSYEDLKNNKDFIKWCEGDNWNNICPNGESGEIMFERAKAALNEYIGSNCIIICHGGIIAKNLMEWFPNDNIHKNYYEWQPKPCEGYKVIFSNNNLPISYFELKL